MAASHTGKLTGADDVVDAAMRQYGVIRVDGLDQLQDTAALLARARQAPSPTASSCIRSPAARGRTSPTWPPPPGSTSRPSPPPSRPSSTSGYPAYLNVANPVDNGGHPVGDWRGRKIIDAILADPVRGRADLPDHRPLPAHERQAGAGPGGRGGTDGQAGVRGVGLAARHRGRLPRDAARLGPGRHLPYVRQLHRRRPRLPLAPPLHHRLPLPLRRGAPRALPLVPQGAGPDAPRPAAQRARGEAAAAGVRDPGAARAAGDQRGGGRARGGARRLPRRHEGLRRAARPQDRTRPGQGRV